MKTRKGRLPFVPRFNFNLLIEPEPGAVLPLKTGSTSELFILANSMYIGQCTGLGKRDIRFWNYQRTAISNQNPRNLSLKSTKNQSGIHGALARQQSSNRLDRVYGG